MQEKHELRTPVERMTDEEIMSAIRYLDPDRSDKRNFDHSNERSAANKGRTALSVCVSLLVLLLGGLAYIWLYLRTT
jgi:hypothetical protein